MSQLTIFRDRTSIKRTGSQYCERGASVHDSVALLVEGLTTPEDVDRFGRITYLSIQLIYEDRAEDGSRDELPFVIDFTVETNKDMHVKVLE